MHTGATLLLFSLSMCLPRAAEATPFQSIPYFRQRMMVIEAENFTVHGTAESAGQCAGTDGNDTKRCGWEPRQWGDGNYFCATINNVFHSRRAFLHGPARAKRSTATAAVVVPQDDEYSVLARYEAVFHFGSGFRIKVEPATGRV
jgi:hypothetical protein